MHDTQKNTQKPARPVIPTGQELYDSIMGHIEPDLTTEEIKTLATKYEQETPEQTAARKKRYELAFERYAQAYEGAIETLQEQVERHRKQSFDHVELKDRTEDMNFLAHLEQTLFHAA